MIDPVCFRSEAGDDFCLAETHAAYIKEDDIVPLDTEQSSFYCAREALRRTWPRCRPPFQNPLGYEIVPLKPATAEYGPRLSSCLISSVIIRATSRSLSSPDLVPNFRRNLLPLSSIGSPPGLHMTTKSSFIRKCPMTLT